MKTPNLTVAAITVVDPSTTDAEFDLKHELRDLNSQRNAAREVMQEKLFLLHQELARCGRGGKFSAFVKNDLGWGERGYDKAMRWIAAYKLRAGLITTDVYQRTMGNGGGATSQPVVEKNNTSRGDCSPEKPEAEVTPEAIEEEDDDTAILVPEVTEEELAEVAEHVEEQTATAPMLMTFRVIMPPDKLRLFKMALALQRRRTGIVTFADLVLRLAIVGRNAVESEDWDGMADTILRDCFLHPDRPELNPDVDDEIDRIMAREAAEDWFNSQFTVEVDAAAKKPVASVAVGQRRTA